MLNIDLYVDVSGPTSWEVDHLRRTAPGLGVSLANHVRALVADADFEAKQQAAASFVREKIDAGIAVMLEGNVIDASDWALITGYDGNGPIGMSPYSSYGGDELILVELKRGKLTREHYDQLRQYMDQASKSKRLRGYLEKGAQLRGILATVEECTFECKDGDVEVRIVDKKHAIEVLACLRETRLARMVEELGGA